LTLSGERYGWVQERGVILSPLASCQTAKTSFVEVQGHTGCAMAQPVLTVPKTIALPLGWNG